MDAISIYHFLVTQAMSRGNAFFQKYTELGRPFLDFLHLVFDNLFNVSLAVLTAVSFIYMITALYIILKKPKPGKEVPVPESRLPFVTVQIPTRNELAAIRCAECCLEFDYPKSKYEILIGDDSDDPEVSSQVAAFARKNSGIIKVFKRESNSGYKAGNLNNLLGHSRGEYIVLFDSDFTPSADFLKRIVAPMVQDKSIHGVQARWKFINAEQNFISILGATIVAFVHHVALPFFSSRRKLGILCGSAEAVRKDTLVKLGGWQHGSLTEDIEYSLRLLDKGHKILYLSSLECCGEVPYTPRDLYKQQMRWAYGVISSVRSHFKVLFFRSRLAAEDKLIICYVFSGYLFSIALAAVIVFGVFSTITHRPEPVNFAKFFWETGRNLLWTSGLLTASGYALAKSGSGRKIGKMVASALSYGIIVTYYVNVGIFRVLTGKPMPWFLLNKLGNRR